MSVFNDTFTVVFTIDRNDKNTITKTRALFDMITRNPGFYSTEDKLVIEFEVKYEELAEFIMVASLELGDANLIVKNIQVIV